VADVQHANTVPQHATAHRRRVTIVADSALLQHKQKHATIPCSSSTHAGAHASVTQTATPPWTTARHAPTHVTDAS
jgi:hypothetical protein